MEVKIITHKEAVLLGLTKPSGEGSPPVIHGVVGRKVGGKDEVMETFKMNMKTGKKDILFQHKDYKTLRQKQGIIK